MSVSLNELQGERLAENRRRVPCQSPNGTIEWYEHVAAHRVYGSRHEQSAERIAERGGFGGEELRAYLGHAPHTFEAVSQ